MSGTNATAPKKPSSRGLAKLHNSNFEMQKSEGKSTSRVNWRQSSHDTRTAENPTRTIDNRKKSYETFEIALGGMTDASIFFDGAHAEKMEQDEFDRLFGARQGRKFRIGQSVEIA